MKQFFRDAFFSRLRNEMQVDEENEKDLSSSPHPNIYTVNAMLDRYEKALKKSQLRVRDLLLKPVLALQFDNQAVHDILAKTVTEQAGVEHGSLKWHYLQGKKEVLQSLDQFITEIPVEQE